MKKINFMHTLSLREQRALIRWYYSSLIIFVSLLSGIILYQGHQVYQLFGMRRACAQLATSLPVHESSTDANLIREKAQLTDRLKYVRTGISITTLQAPLQFVVQACQNSVSLRTYRMTDSTITCSLACANTRDVMQVVHALNKNDLFASVKLVHLQMQSIATEPLLATLVLTIRVDAELRSGVIG